MFTIQIENYKKTIIATVDLPYLHTNYEQIENRLIHAYKILRYGE